VAARDINSIEQVLVSIVVEVCPKRLIVQVICTRTKNGRCLLLFLLDYGLVFRFGWRCEVNVSIEVVFLELDGLDLHDLDFLEILFVI
jgi:hypothetical protein